MLILRIKQAETALKDSRLDEAYELARTDDFRTHREGQKLVSQLVRALIARGQDHLTADRLGQAATDCEKAERLGGNLSEVAALRAAVTEAIQARQQAERRQAGRLAAARQHIHNGWLSFGEQILSDTEGSGTEPLREEAEIRREKAEQALNRAEQALNRQDWAAAVDSLREAKQAHASNPRIGTLTDQTVSLVAEQTARTLDNGRLDAAEAMLGELETLVSPNLQIQDLARFLRECRHAAGLLDRGQPRQAADILHRLSAARPGAGWLTEASRCAEQAAANLENLHRGPLGWFADTCSAAASTAPASNEGRTEVIRSEHLMRSEHPAVPNRFLLHVDTVGSFLVLRQPRVSVGPISSSRRPDLGLLADAGLPVITIERQEEDYFLSSEVPVRVNDMPVQKKLLSSGDRISLGPRCQMKFTLPSAASTSAMLQLSGCRLPQGDARQVILMDRSIVLGPGTTGHIRADQMTSPAVLHVRDGRLLIRGNGDMKVNDRPMDDRMGIPMGARVSIGPISLAVAAVDTKA